MKIIKGFFAKKAVLRNLSERTFTKQNFENHYWKQFFKSLILLRKNLYVAWRMNEFAKLRALVPSCLPALRAFVPSHLTRLRALRAFASYVPWFLRALITCLGLLICYMRTLLTRDIKSLIKGRHKGTQGT